MLLTLLLTLSLARASEPPPCDLSGAGRSAHLITIGSAPQADRAFGHTGVLLYEPQYADQSVLYDFGNFDASSPLNIAWDVVTGTQVYWLAKKRWGLFAEHYGEGHGRSVQLQQLRITDAQFETLARTLYKAEAETPSFAYNWYTPNCTTQVRDTLDALLDGVLKPQHQAMSGRTPARQVLRHSANLPLMWFGLHWGSGRLADQEISWWDAMFLPETLAERLDASTVPTPTGPQPLVVSKCLVAPGRVDPLPPTAPNRDAWLWAIGLAAGGLAYGAGRTRAGLRAVTAQGIAVGIFGCAALLIGVLGTFAPFWTAHNLYFANPLHLGLIAAAWIASRHPTSLLPERIALGLLGLGGVGVLASLVHGLADRNLGIFGLMLPIGVAAALTLRDTRRLAVEGG